MNGVSYMTGKSKTVAGVIGSKTDGAKKARAIASVESQAARTGKRQSISYQNKKGTIDVTHIAEPNPKGRPKTGTTYEAPKVTVTRVSHPKNNSKDKIS